MITLDLSHVTPPRVYPLDERFRGTAPDGREVGFTNAFMTLNGKPFFGVSGEMHYARVSPDQWEDAVVKMRCGGVNLLSTYVFWNVHEEEEGVFRFDGCRNLRGFLEVCERHRMMVIVRLGPFDHGEMRNGGLPDWLYGKPFEVRNDNPGFLGAVRRLYRQLHRQMDGHYFSQGGCIVGAQIENEYEHSSAPWEVTTGVSGEWVEGGHSGERYMRALKRIMIEEGIVTPFYTATSWGGAAVPVDEALPLWGGYAYQPWLFYRHSGTHPATPEYLYRDNHNSAVAKTYNFEPRYDPETRPYACCEMMGGMMCSYRYRFRLDMRAVDALANIKLGSGCNLLGYYMYKGGTTPTGRRAPFLNENQVPKRSYDFQAALGEFGQVRESYGRLRAIHLFCQTFSGFLETTKVVLPDYSGELAPEDLGPLRCAARVTGSSGFLFVNNFQDHVELRDRRGDGVRLMLPGGEVIFRFDIAAGENAILPFGIDLGGVRLDWATAQPLAHVGDTWFFFAPEGMAPAYCLDGRVHEARPGGAIRCGGVTIMTLSRRESLGFNVLDVHARRRAFLCEKPLLWDGERLSVELETGGADVFAWSEVQGRFERIARAESGNAVLPARFTAVAPGRYTVGLPEAGLAGHKQVLLRVDYRGDIGHAFVNGALISDNFCNGAPWDIRVDDQAEALAAHPLTLYITPVKEDVTVDASAMAGQIERVGRATAELLCAQWIMIDDVPVPAGN